MKRLIIISVSILSAWSVTGWSAVSLVDNNGWNVLLSGFAELDMMNDSTRSYAETMGNTVIAKPGTLAGDDGRTVFSIRNSRLGFAVLPPAVEHWKTKGYLEFDLFGADNGTKESSIYASPTVRLRHAYLFADNDGLQFFAGQTWSLFGWQTYYLPPTVSVAPMSGVIFQRTPQLTAIDTFGSVQAGISLVRPAQRDSQYPGVEAGLRYSYQGRKSKYLNGSSVDVTLQPLSMALTSTLRDYETPNNSDSKGQTHYGGYGVALDMMIPILTAASADSAEHALVLSGEVTTGQGYGDAFTYWAGLPALTAGTTSFASTQTNLDPGIGGFNSSGSFNLVQLTTANLVLQYHLPTESHTVINVGYGRFDAPNAGSLSGTYDRSETYFTNLYHDFTKQVRVGFEYSYEQTRYTDATVAHNSRWQISSWFRM